MHLNSAGLQVGQVVFRHGMHVHVLSAYSCLAIRLHEREGIFLICSNLGAIYRYLWCCRLPAGYCGGDISWRMLNDIMTISGLPKNILDKASSLQNCFCSSVACYGQHKRSRRNCDEGPKAAADDLLLSISLLGLYPVLLDSSEGTRSLVRISETIS